MPTLIQYRKRAARELGAYQEGTATSGSTTAQLECTAAPFKTTLSTASLFQDWWLYRPNAALAADKLRLVKTYDPTNGLFTPDLAYTNGANGESFELHGVLPPYVDGQNDLHTLINDVLRRIPVTAEFTLATINQQTRHSLATAASWLNDPLQVRWVGYLTGSETRNQVNPYSRRVRGETLYDGSTYWLDHWPRTFNAATDTLYCWAVKPAYNHCAASGGTLGAQNGLTLDTDIAYPQEDWVALGVLVEVYQRFAHLLEASSNQRLVKDAATAAARFSYLTDVYYREPELYFRPVMHSGPLRGTDSLGSGSWE